MTDTPTEFAGKYNGMDLLIKRDDTIPLTFGTKARKYAGLRNWLAENRIRNVILSGNFHSNFLAVFSWLLAVDGFEVTAVVQSRNPERITANSVITENSANVLYRVVTRDQREEQVKELARLNRGFVIPDYGMHISCLEGLHSLWEELESETFDTLVLDIGSGQTLLSLYHFYQTRNLEIPFKVIGVAIGNRSDKLEQELAGLAAGFGLELSPLVLVDPLIDPAYGRHSARLDSWILEFYKEKNILAEPVYSGKSLYTIIKMAEAGNLTGKVLYLHQGGQLNFIDIASG